MACRVAAFARALASVLIAVSERVLPLPDQRTFAAFLAIADRRAGPSARALAFPPTDCGLDIRKKVFSKLQACKHRKHSPLARGLDGAPHSAG